MPKPIIEVCTPMKSVSSAKIVYGQISVWPNCFIGHIVTDGAAKSIYIKTC